MKRIYLLLLFLGLAAPAQAEQQSPPVVVELFTSQGCSSCPPADALLGELAARPGILALSFHVDYWNYLGWRDPFSSPESTQRQYGYGRAFNLRTVYTPQMVVQGRKELVGSRKGAVEQAVVHADPGLAVNLSWQGEVLQVGLPDLPQEVELWLVVYDSGQVTQIKRGENRGRRLHNRNVVRRFERFDPQLVLTRADVFAQGGESLALLIQEPGQGAILGSGVLSP